MIIIIKLYIYSYIYNCCIEYVCTFQYVYNCIYIYILYNKHMDML